LDLKGCPFANRRFPKGETACPGQTKEIFPHLFNVRASADFIQTPARFLPVFALAPHFFTFMLFLL
jgi:hypothetical protein